MVCGGGAWGRGSALLTADGKHVLVAVASHIRLYSSVSGEFVTSLSEHAADVTAVVLDHASNDKIYSASLDGTVKHWDYTSGQMLQSFKVNNPVQSMVIPAGGEMAYLQCDWVLEKAGKMLFLDLAEGGLAPYSLRLYQPSKYVVSPSGLFVATFFMKTVFIYSTKRPALPPLKLYHTREITCVAIDPTEERVAAGDNTGRILIWTGFKDKVPTLHRATPAATAVPTTSATAAAKKAAHNSDSGSDSDGSEDAQQDSAGGERQQPVAQPGSSKTNTSGEAAAVTGSVVPSRKSRQEHFSRLQRSRASVPVTTVHWHAHPVGALCFSADGTLLLSGGEEAVLVVWQLDSSHRTFLPRLGGPLTCITRSAVDAGCYVISQADNTVRMVNTASMKVEVSILGMRPPPRTVSALQSTSTAVLAPGGGELVLPTDNSMLQFWDAARDRHVNRLQVAPRNTVSLTQQDHALQGGMYGMPLEPHVSHVAFSSDGLVMATVDVRPNAGSLGSDEQSLRFWDRSEGGVTLGSSQEQPMYTMNTFLDDPHRQVSSMCTQETLSILSSGGSIAHSVSLRAAQECEPACLPPRASSRPRAACSGRQTCWLTLLCCPRTYTVCNQPAVGQQTSAEVNAGKRGGVITSLAYHPSRNLAASTGSSGDIKMWVQQAERSKGRAAHWRCQSVGYHTAGAMSAAAFSGDGSLLAAASQDQVTLWDPDSNAMVSCLASPPANLGSPLRKLCFVPHSAYLVGYTTGANPSLIVWNLLTQSIWWSYQLAVSAMAADPKSGSIAVAMLPGDAQVGKSSQRTSAASGQAEGGAISQAKASSSVSKILRQGAMTVTRPDDDQSATASAVFLFCAATGQPRLSWSLGQSTAAALLFALPGTHLQSSAAAATPDGLSPLMIVLQDRQYTFAKSASSMQGASVQAVSLEQGQEPSAFEAAFGRPAVPQPAQQGAGVAHFQSDIQGRLQTLFDAPSHVLPALKDLAPMFFNSFTEHSSKLV